MEFHNYFDIPISICACDIRHRKLSEFNPVIFNLKLSSLLPGLIWGVTRFDVYTDTSPSINYSLFNNVQYTYLLKLFRDLSRNFLKKSIHLTRFCRFFSNINFNIKRNGWTYWRYVKTEEGNEKNRFLNFVSNFPWIHLFDVTVNRRQLHSA